MSQIIELERHFNALELNKFGDRGRAPMGRRTFHSSSESSRYERYLFFRRTVLCCSHEDPFLCMMNYYCSLGDYHVFFITVVVACEYHMVLFHI